MPDFQTIYQQSIKEFKQIRRQYKLARFSQSLIFGVALIFLFLIMLPTAMLMLSIPSKYDDIVQKILNIYTEPGSFFMIYVFLFVWVLTMVFGYIYSKVMPALRKKEAKTADNLIYRLFPGLQISKNIQVKAQQLKASKIFAWFDPYMYAKQSEGAGSPIYTFGTLEKRQNNLLTYIADIGIVENTLKHKSKHFLFKIPVINWFLLLYEYFFKRAFTSKLADQLDYTFRGLFSWAKFDKKLEGITVILPDDLEKKIGYLARTVQALNFKRDDIVYMEDPEFEKEFVVYTTNDIEARYLLSASMMERMTELKRRFNRPVMFSFVDNAIYIAIAAPTGLFSWDMESLKSSQAIEELYHDVQCCINMIDDLKLDSKIWG